MRKEHNRSKATAEQESRAGEKRKTEEASGGARALNDRHKKSAIRRFFWNL